MTDSRKYYFTTFALNNWISTFEDYPESVELIYESFDFMTVNKWVKIYAFVIMRDHIHVIWEAFADKQIISIIDGFKINTGRAISSFLMKADSDYLEEYFSTNRKDRRYHIWKQGYGNLEIRDSSVLLQKLNYIHLNPTRGDYKLVSCSHKYPHSSAMSYYLKKSQFSFLTLI